MGELRRPATRIRRNLRELLFALSPAVIAPLAVIWPALLYLAGVGLMWGILGGVLAWRQNRAPRREEAELVVDGEALCFGDLAIPRTAVVGATWRDDARFGPLVDVELGRHRRLRLAVATADDARDVVAALGCDPSRRIAAFAGLSRLVLAPRWTRMVALIGPVVVAPFLIALLVPRDLVWLVTLTVAPWLGTLAAFAPARFEVGSDGIAIRWLFTRSFVAFAEVDRVELVDIDVGQDRYLGVELVLCSGARRRLAVERRHEGASEAQRLLERIRDAMRLRGATASAAVAEALARRDRDPGQWVASLGAIATGARSDHRTGAVSRDDLWAVVDDGAAPAAARAAAAVALARGTTGEEREVLEAQRRRIRVAATATASPPLRLALERAASPDVTDEALADALAELEGDASGSLSMPRRSRA